MPGSGILRLDLLGGFALRAAGIGIPISVKKGRALLAYLAMHAERDTSREHLATLFWGDRADRHARQSLRQCLRFLRCELSAHAADLLVARGEGIGLQPGSVSVDAREFAALAGSEQIADIERAAQLYAGRFLAGFTLDVEPFDEWVRAEQDRLETMAARVLERCVDHYEKTGDGRRVIDAAARLIMIDPLREDWHRLMLRLRVRYQGRDAAIAHGRTLIARLRRELDVDPAPATQALIAAIAAGAIASSGPGLIVSAPPSATTGLAAPASYVAVRSSKPAIAIAPFGNLSADPVLSQVADGITIELITILSRIRSLAIASSAARFPDPGRKAKPTPIGRELGVDYMIEGSLRTADLRLRITARLVDAEDGSHIWVQRFERSVRDVFALQDGIAASIAAAVEPRVYAAEGARAARQPAQALDARGCVMRAFALINARSQHNYALAQELLRRAIEIDPSCTHAYSLLAYVTGLDVVYGWKPRGEMATALAAAHNAVLLDVDDAWAHLALGFVLAQSKQTEAAIREFEKALALNPGFGIAYTYLGSALSHLGRTDQALAQIDAAERASPREMFFGVNNYVRANAHFAAERYSDASVFARRSVLESPGIVTSHRQRVVNCVLAGEMEDARAALAALLRLVPGSTLKSIGDALPYVRDQDRERFLEAFHRMGLE